MKILKHLNLSIAVVILLISCIFIPVMTAFMVSGSSVRNYFSIGFNESNIEETFGEYTQLQAGEDYEKIVAVKNSGNVPCYVRVFAETENPETAEGININFNNKDWTARQGDGFYYYKNALNPDDVTQPLFTSVTAKTDISELNLICYSETVQAEGADDAVTAFAQFN